MKLHPLCLISLAFSLAVASGCGDDEDSSTDSGTSASSASNGTVSASSAGTQSTTASSASGDGSGGAMACEDAGGVCDCVGSCRDSFEPADPSQNLSCPQPPDEAGACSMECCVPTSDTTGTTATTGMSEPCPCPPDLAACPADEAACDQVGEQCCDAKGRLNECTANDIGVLWLTQFC